VIMLVLQSTNSLYQDQKTLVVEVDHRIKELNRATHLRENELRAELGTKLDGFKDVMKVQLLQLLLLLYSPQTSQNVINYKLRTLRLRHVTRISLTDTPSTRFLE